MARRSISSDELLLVVLRLLEQRAMSARELLGEMDRLLEWRRGPRPGDVLIALASLEDEALVEVMSSAEREEYRIAERGREAVARRAAVTVLPGAPRSRRPRVASRRSRQRELEQAAILFTDVVRSTELLDRLGDEAAHEVRRRHFDLLRKAVREHGGREIKSLGDGLMTVFESTQAAAAGALAMQHAVAACEDEVQLRVGIAAGETVREDDDYFGRPVVVAKRLCDAASAGEVLVSGPARGLVADSAIGGERLAPLALKGLSEPVTPTVLRARELAPVG
jgi:class 3 adenylate cyclase